jgi:hypothetical protein
MEPVRLTDHSIAAFTSLREKLLVRSPRPISQAGVEMDTTKKRRPTRQCLVSIAGVLGQRPPYAPELWANLS